MKIDRAPPPPPEKIRVQHKKKKSHGQKRKVSQLRSSPSRPRGSGSSDDGPASADLRSPPRRAPVVPGLDVSPPPPADTPNRMRARRRSGRPAGQGQLRCPNPRCLDSALTFSTEGNRLRHEQDTCSSRIQVMNNNVLNTFIK